MANQKFTTEEEWHALRDAHIGGSDVAALFNLWRDADGVERVRHLFEAVPEDSLCLGSLSPYKTGYRLWMEKAGRLAPDDLSEVERVLAGQFMEPAIAAWANRRWPDWKLLKSRVYHVHPDVPGFGASLDYFIQKGAQPVDIKNVDGLQFKRKWLLDSDTGEIVDFPMAIVLQIQHQIACTGAERGWVLACVGGNELRRGSMPRHQPTIDKIETAVRAFWAAVAAGIEPMDADFGTVKEVYFFGDAKDTDNPPVDWTGTTTEAEDADRVVRRYLRWNDHLKFVTQQVDLLKGRVGQHVGTAYRAKFNSANVTWPTIHREAKTVSYDVAEKTYRGGMTVTRIKDAT